MHIALKTLIDLSHKGCGGGIELRYSDITGQYYISVPFERKEGICLVGLNHHADTIEESAVGILEQMKGQLLVFNAHSESRKEIYYYSE